MEGRERRYEKKMMTGTARACSRGDCSGIASVLGCFCRLQQQASWMELTPLPVRPVGGLWAIKSSSVDFRYLLVYLCKYPALAFTLFDLAFYPVHPEEGYSGRAGSVPGRDFYKRLKRKGWERGREGRKRELGCREVPSKTLINHGAGASRPKSWGLKGDRGKKKRKKSKAHEEETRNPFGRLFSSQPAKLPHDVTTCPFFVSTDPPFPSHGDLLAPSVFVNSAHSFLPQLCVAIPPPPRLLPLPPFPKVFSVTSPSSVYLLLFFLFLFLFLFFVPLSPLIRFGQRSVAPRD